MSEEPLYLDDKTIAKKIGLKPELAAATFAIFERAGFPRQSAVIGNKRYWPAVRAFLDRREGLVPDRDGTSTSYNPELENWE